MRHEQIRLDMGHGHISLDMGHGQKRTGHRTQTHETRRLTRTDEDWAWYTGT